MREATMISPFQLVFLVKEMTISNQVRMEISQLFITVRNGFPQNRWFKYCFLSLFLKLFLEYGRFFQKWYFDNLLAHGDRVLEAAAKVLKPAGMKIAAKVAGIHWWVLDESRAAEMTAGYYMNNGNDGKNPLIF